MTRTGRIRGGGRRCRRILRRGSAVLGATLAVSAASLLLPGGTPTTAAPGPDHAGAACREVAAPVRAGVLAATVRASLCLPPGGSEVLEILVAGGIR